MLTYIVLGIGIIGLVASLTAHMVFAWRMKRNEGSGIRIERKSV